MTRYQGTCVGGPFDGKPTYHGLPVMPVAIKGMQAITWAGPETDDIKYGYYRHEGDRWIWDPPK